MFDEQKRMQHIAEIKQRREQQRKHDRRQAIAFLVTIALVFVGSITYVVSSLGSDDKKNNNIKTESHVEQNSDTIIQQASHKTEVKDGVTYIDGIMIANKSYSMPKEFDPGLSQEASAAFDKMAAAASKDGLFIYICSGYRNYNDQEYQYQQYAQERGVQEADKISARPGHSEHQTGLAIDVNCTEFSFENTEEGKWLAKHCVEYGFIIRFPKGKEKATGFEYEPWHIRYLGIDDAKKVSESGLSLEEYLGITSEYKD